MTTKEKLDSALTDFRAKYGFRKDTITLCFKCFRSLLHETKEVHVTKNTEMYHGKPIIVDSNMRCLTCNIEGTSTENIG